MEVNFTVVQSISGSEHLRWRSHGDVTRRTVTSSNRNKQEKSQEGKRLYREKDGRGEVEMEV